MECVPFLDYMKIYRISYCFFVYLCAITPYFELHSFNMQKIKETLL